MPKRRRGNRKPFSKGQYKAVAKIANKQIHKLSELHTLDTYSSTIAVTTSHTPVAVAMPIQGLGSSERVGDSIYVRGYQCRYQLANESDPDLIMRVIWFQWMESQSAPALSDILQNTTAIQAVNSFYVTNPQKKFKILSDQVHLWDSNANSVGYRQITQSFNGKDFTIHKPDFDGTASQNCTGRIYYTVISNVPNVGTMTSIQERLRYFDN